MMELFPWNTTYETHVEQIDEQHKQLVKYLNDLFEAMKNGKGYDVLSDILTGLTNYTVEHFGTEEKLMRENNYPDLEKHKEEHRKLVEEIKQFKTDFENKKRTVSIDLMNYLKSWLTDHILNTDKKLGKYLTQNV